VGDELESILNPEYAGREKISLPLATHRGVDV
jgi:hypothetical protein